MTMRHSAGLTWRAPVRSPSHLPVLAKDGDAYFCIDTDESYAYTGGKWVKIIGIGEEEEENRFDKVIRIMNDVETNK